MKRKENANKIIKKQSKKQEITKKIKPIYKLQLSQRGN